MKPTYLYIKQHTLTKLKYFGKTTKKSPIEYLGSGKYWKKHIKKHGEQHVETIWCQLFTDKNDLEKFALNFSKDNNIVESTEWANLKNENGLDGGFDKHTIESNKKNSDKAKQRWNSGVYDVEKLRLSRIGFKQPQSQKDSVSKALSKSWNVTSPQGTTHTINNLREFCKNNGLDQGNMVKVSKGILKQHKGWKCVKICLS